ncbi:Mlp1p [Sugiyamaella lignohabitans]|uniref:Mlp1p n=1 Tax=Sugiyamaella lignohabitans TaxID=796027 RepID=A0A167EMB3_9ASCO|nr:Mlp1p [Sugiyamaella lignohabitans]ANB14246.1 Mlp1p [Sugiyamaella lignohabitans]
MQNELDQVHSQTNTSSDGMRSLQQRIESLTNDKRHLFETLERRSSELRELRSELESAHQKSLDARKQIVELENQAQQARSSQMSSKLKEQSLGQEIELLKRSNDWLDSELKAKSEEFKKFRTERMTKLSTLQSEYDSLQSNHSSLVKRYDALQARFDEVSQSYDSSLVKIKDLQNAQVVAEESFRSEMAAQHRLTELWERSANESKARVEELQRTKSKDQSSQAAEMARWKAEAEKAREKADKFEKQMKNLETRLETVFSQNDNLVAADKVAGSVPSTPGPGSPQTPSRNGASSSNIGIFSPSGQIISKLQKSGGSLVQLYSDLQETKILLEKERHKNEVLRREMDNILEEMEDHAPIIMAEREEHRRLEVELAELSTQLEKATSDSDEFKAKLKVVESKYNDSITEKDIITQQVRDLSRQVQHLLVQRQLESDAEAPLTPQEHAELQRLLRTSDDDIGNTGSDTQRVISERLVLFKDIIELQKQNEYLLNATRELAEKTEKMDAASKKDYENLESAAVEEAKQAIKSLQEELARVNIKYDALKRERDMFRSMLKSGESNSGANNAPGGSSDQVEKLIAQHQEATQVIKQVEQNFEVYRNETSITIKTLNDQISSITNERTALQLKIAKLESQVEIAGERSKHSNSNLQLLQSENQELKKRNESLQESLSKQDLRTYQVAEELIDSKSLLDSVKNELSNLKAEKSLWKSIEERISKENAEHLEEKGRLNGILKNMEIVNAEREKNFQDTERRLNKQVDSLEAQVSRLNQKLEMEEREVKSLSDRRDVDNAEFNSKLESLRQELKKAQDNLAAAKSENEELSRIRRQLSAEIAAANEQLAVYKSQPGSTLETKLSEEIEILKRSLKEKDEQLASADKHIHDLTEVASAAEEALGSLNSSHEEYTASITENIAKKDSEIVNLKERLQVTTGILESTTKELDSIKSAKARGADDLKAEKEKLEARIAALLESEERFTKNQQDLKRDLEQQAIIAKEAQDNYEKELVKHAKAADTVQLLRAEVSQLKEQTIELHSKADSAAAQLSNAEASWDNQKYTYEHEIEQLKSRTEELASQNKTLLEQLESISSRVSNIKPEAGITGENVESEEPSSDDQLREIISYLRREKEIVDCNYELAQQESRRLKQQLDHTTAALDEAKVEIERERQRESDSLRIAAEHAKVIKQLEDINLLRESNSTLRTQSNYYMAKAKELETELNSVKERVEPLEDQLREAVAESEAKDSQIKIIEEDNEKWKQRAQQILQKYQRIDPEELQALKDEAEKLRTSLTALEEEKKQLQSQITVAVEAKAKEFEAKLAESAENYTSLNNKFSRLRDESQSKLAKRRGEVNQVREELNKSIAENTQLKESLENAKKELEAANTAQNTLGASNQAELAKLRTELTTTKEALEKAKSSPSQADDTEKDKRIAHLESEVNRLSDEAVELQRAQEMSGTEANAKVIELTQQKAHAEQRIVTLSNELTSLRESLSKAISNEQHEQKLNELKQQLEAAKQASNGSASGTDGNAVDIEALRKQVMEEAERSAINRLKANAQRRLAESTEKRKSELEAEFSRKEEELKKEYAQKEEELKAQLSQGGNGTGVDKEKLEALEKEYKAKNESLVSKHTEELKTATQAGRDAAAKEGAMRVQLLVKKAEKLEKEKAQLESEKNQLALQIRRLKGGEDIAGPTPAAAVNPAVGQNPVTSGGAGPKAAGGFARPTFASTASSATGGGQAQSSIPTAGGRLRPPTSVAGVSRPAGAQARPTIVRPGIARPGGAPATAQVSQILNAAAADATGAKRAASNDNSTNQDPKRRKE